MEDAVSHANVAVPPASPISGAYRDLADGIRELAENVRRPVADVLPVADAAPRATGPLPAATPGHGLVRKVLATLFELFVVMFAIPVAVFHVAMLLFPPAR